MTKPKEKFYVDVEICKRCSFVMEADSEEDAREALDSADMAFSDACEFDFDDPEILVVPCKKENVQAEWGILDGEIVKVSNPDYQTSLLEGEDDEPEPDLKTLPLFPDGQEEKKEE